MITEPAAGAYRPASRLLDSLPLLPADRAGDIDALLAPAGPRLVELAAHYFGDTADGASTRRFEAALTELIERRRASVSERARRERP